MLKDPLYIGLRHKRIRGQAYDDLLDEFMEAVTSRYVIYLCYSLVNSIVNFILGEINVLSYVNLSYVKQCLNLPSLQVLGLHALCTDSLKIKNRNINNKTEKGKESASTQTNTGPSF